MLTDTKLRKALGKKRDTIEVIADAHGLNVRISQAGKVTFFYRYRWLSKPVQITVGEYPQMTIAQARERRQVMRSWLTEGYDPREKVKLERLSRSDSPTVDDAFTYWIEKYCKANSSVKIDYYQLVYAKHVQPKLGNLRIEATGRMHWLEVLDGIKSSVMANYMTSLCKRAFKFCVNRGYIEANPLEGLEPKDVGIAPSRRKRYLSDREMKQVWSWLDDHMTDEPRLMIRFMMLTGCRTAEIRCAKWEWFDFEDNTWTVPKEEYKTGVAVRRALPAAAKALLLEHKEKVNTRYVATSQRPALGKEFDRPVGNQVAANYAKSVFEGAGMERWSMHDLRRTLATKLSEQGCPPHVIEKILGHAMAGVMAHYNLHDYMDDQRKWLSVWEDYVKKVTM
ncbi:tyrosine-type recombinase/integrase [Serratia fonticola]|uniref:tyrosine-type recombinase/integrase n=1 Tax=Serratia fonticola TaxID=47917 RepID=UPI001647B061|nr:site-specific integrase [Serratia fonticola]MBC3251254.1 tyrosine-type recombinase/integrase [Serratia fonticola]